MRLRFGETGMAVVMIAWLWRVLGMYLERADDYELPDDLLLSE